VSDGDQWAGVRRVLDRAITDGVFPGAALLIGRCDEILAELYTGALANGEAAVSSETLYDLSSLTKPLATMSLLLRMVARGDVALDDAFASIYPQFVATGPRAERSMRESVTIADLVSHQAGLQAVGGFWKRLQAEYPQLIGKAVAAGIVAGYAAEMPLAATPRSRALYSDLGFIMLGCALERLGRDSLDKLVAREFVAPLDADVSYRPLEDPPPAEADCDHLAPCGSCQWRDGVVRGAVQDENAWAMGGVAGHAGLFGTALGVHRLVAEYVAASQGRGRLLDSALVQRCWQPQPGAPSGSTWAAGWDTPTAGSSSAGSHISPCSVGHLGFTGTSVWVDRVRGVHVVLLTNRLHPDRANIQIRKLRPGIHDEVFSAIDRGAGAATASS